MNLTSRQLDAAVAIRNYRHLHGYAPTLQELADTLGVTKVSAHELVNGLEKKGVIRREKHKARSIEIVADASLPDEDRPSKLPLLGNIAAGSPIQSVDVREEIDLEQLFHSRHGVYVLRVRGAGMESDHLCDRDCIVVERRDSARVGQTVVALDSRGAAAIKVFERTNPAMTVLGAVLGMMRTYEN